MAQPEQDANMMQWLLGLLGSVVVGWVAWLWSKIDSLTRQIAEGDAKTAAAAANGDRDLWTAVNRDREVADAARTRMLERLAEVSTKADLIAMETRINQRLDRANH